MGYDLAVLFAALRAAPFGGRLTSGQVGGVRALLLAAPADLAREPLAYCLATAFWETGRTMQPVRESGRGIGRSYGAPDPTTRQAYYGRGYVQLTWLDNYRKGGAALGLDLVGQPDLALEPATAARILFGGMREGWFTGRRLAEFFGNGRDDPLGARRIVNGTDHAAEIAVIHRACLAALTAASRPASSPRPSARPRTLTRSRPAAAKPAATIPLRVRIGRWIDRVFG